MDVWTRFSIEVSHRPAIYYLAYGSNLSLERMAKRCPDAVVAGTAKIPGYRLLFKKSGSGFYATIEQDANVILFVQNAPADAPELHGADSYRETGVRIAKNRDGALGTIRMRWQPQYHDWQPDAPTQKELEEMDPFKD